MPVSKEELLNGLTHFKTRQDQYNETKFAQNSDLVGAMRYRGSVDSFADLPADAATGDVYGVRNSGGTDDFGTSIKAGDNVARTADGKWDCLGGNYVSETITQADIDKIFDGE